MKTLSEIMKNAVGRAGRMGRRFTSGDKGVAAIEFAFVAPVLLCLYLGSMEMGQAIEANKKVGRISSMVADLVTQQSAVDRDQLKGIMNIGSSLLRPYGRSKPTITVTGIQMNGNATPSATEVWWRRLKADGTTDGGSSTSQTATPAVPTKLLVKDTFLVRVQTALNYKWVLTYTQDSGNMFGVGRFWQGISMGETYYLRPRVSNTVTCSNC